MHVIAAKAICFKEAMTDEFMAYQKQIINNARAMAERFKELGVKLVSDGTDNHMMLLDLRNKGITGKQADHALEEAGITVNKNTIPFDPQSPFVTSGVRIGTPAATTRGMKEKEMRLIAELINKVISDVDNQEVIDSVRAEVRELCGKFVD